MLDEIEDSKKVYVVSSTNTGNEYSLVIFKEKIERVFRIINLTKGHICPSEFDTYEQAEEDIYRYQAKGKNRITNLEELPY